MTQLGFKSKTFLLRIKNSNHPTTLAVGSKWMSIPFTCDAVQIHKPPMTSALMKCHPKNALHRVTQGGKWHDSVQCMTACINDM